MKHFLLFYDFVDDYVTRRTALRAGHLSLAWAAVERGELLLGGALTDPVDTGLLLFKGETPEVAESFARIDPYVTNGLVKAWCVREWTTVVGVEPAQKVIP